MKRIGPPRQDIDIDRARLLVIVTVSGFFTPDATHDWMMEVRRAVRSLGRDVGRHVTLYDLTDIAPAPAATVDLIATAFANPVYRPIWARRVAFVAQSPLLRRQIERVRVARPDIGLFASREAALDWLFAPDDQAPPR